MHMLAGFHPVVSRWFADTLGEPTRAQRHGWEAIRAGCHTLIAAPTGSGKTLAAFLTAIDQLVREGLASPLPDEVRVVYVSPLKALSADIHKNLAEPRKAIRHILESSGLPAPRITVAVRTGDTSQRERAAMLRTPPHVLVTTPESLYLLLTAERSRGMLRTVRTVIVDEIHAVIGTRRGAHLALSLERLEALCAAEPAGTETVDPAGEPRRAIDPRETPLPVPALQRIGLSATQKPVDEVARYLVGADPARGGCTIVDEGHRRAIDLALEMPRSPLGAVLAHEVWEEYYDRLAELIAAHRTTLVFVNTRRLAERLTRHLSDRLGAEAVTAHHGSLSRERRLDAEHRLKTGALKALVATASLELGIDIGYVDLVCQVGSPNRIATLLQRVGRSGHSVTGTPKGRLLPTSRDDLVECAALLRSVRAGDLDGVVQHDAPLDVLAQQLTAEAACRDWCEDDLFGMIRRAWPYRALSRADFDTVVTMLADGFSTRRGRRAALLHRDEVHRRVRGRRGSRMLAITSGGAIPELADYRVVLAPEDTFIGTLNEDFALESMAGDVFQLGNASWRVLRVTSGTVRVADAQGAPPNIPFWLGEAPARSDELSRAVSTVRATVERMLEPEGPVATSDDGRAGGNEGAAGFHCTAAVEWLERDAALSRAAAEQIVEYLAEGFRVLGAVPTQDTLVLERFFDESGGMQLVLHAPFGTRINRAWALALRKRFCRQFNFELQAAATEEALLLSLGPQHSFPLADVYRYLHPSTVRDILVQALLDAPVFQTRWRWNATISLAVPRSRAGSKVPPQLQRMWSDDLMAAVFPDAAACLENIPGDRQVPDHPLVNQTVRDCLEEAMDLPGFIAVLERIHRGELRCLARDTPEPSAFAHEILSARPYAFVDDAPLEERRAHAVQTRRAGGPRDEYGALDASALARVRDEERPDPRTADELHDTLLSVGYLTAQEADAEMLQQLAAAGRATRATIARGRSDPPDYSSVMGTTLLVAAERLPELMAVHPEASLDPLIPAPSARMARTWTRSAALTELLRGRLSIVGPATEAALADSLCVERTDAGESLLALESEGAVLRGRFSPGEPALEWCDRRLLARIHRYTLNRLRAEIAPVSPAEFMRFLFVWQHVDPLHRLTGIDGLRAVLGQLDGVEVPARAWERDVLTARLERYDATHLDTLCLIGEVGWARLSTGPTQVVGSTPVALFLREHAELWLAARTGAPHAQSPALERTGNAARSDAPITSGSPGFEPQAWQRGAHAALDASEADHAAAVARVIDWLRTHGASFVHDLSAGCSLTHDTLRAALAALVAAGRVSSDGFAGLRALVGTAQTLRAPRLNRVDAAGRWFVLLPTGDGPPWDAAIEQIAWILLRRYGVVFRRVLAREALAVPWRDLARVYRRLEARGEIRGGRFVSGMSGEQFALPDAVERLREVRRAPSETTLLTISAADPLNLTGIITPGDRIRAVAASRIVYRNGVPLAALEGDLIRTLAEVEPALAADVAAAAAGRAVPVVTGYVGARHR
jgi:ATP-dependent helicase Lhr and Lhr-like helicase